MCRCTAAGGWAPTFSSSSEVTSWIRPRSFSTDTTLATGAGPLLLLLPLLLLVPAQGMVREMLVGERGGGDADHTSAHGFTKDAAANALCAQLGKDL